MHRPWGAALAVLATTAAVLAPAVAGQPTSNKPKTLAYANGPITALAQDGGRIAWAAVKNCIATVRVRTLVPGSQTGVGSADTNNCASDTDLGGLGDMQLALAGDRALWSYGEVGNLSYTWLKTGSVSGAKNQQLSDPLAYDNGTYETGDHFTALAGDGSTLVYSFVKIGVTGTSDCDLDSTCTVVVSGGGVRRMTGASSVAVAGAPPAVAVATGSGRVALVQASVLGTKPAPKPSSAVQVRNALTGALVTSFTPVGTVRAVALGSAVAAVLVAGAGGTRIERYSVPGGALLASTSVPALTAHELSTNGSVVVFRVGLSIRRVPVSAGAVSVVATAKATPVDLSVEGTRVIWAENRASGGGLKGRIQTISL